jgi:methylated-DNA-[protein]-cysteine S-methyltransferase
MRCHNAPMNRSFALFQTAIGALAVVWGRQGIAGLRLPEVDEATLRRRILRRYPDAAEERPLPGIDLAIRDMRRLLDGEPVDLSRIALDFTGIPDFDQRVYAIARAIPPGETRTYGEIARQLGDISLSREVGQSLGRNPFPVVVPCHRVLAANGRTGGFSAPAGVTTKLRMLAIERARFGAAPSLFDAVGGLPLAVAR